MQMTNYEEKSLQRLGEAITDGRWSNEALVQLIELAGSYLNLMTIIDYAARKKMTYQAAKKNTSYRKNVTIFNTKFIIDND
jgi:hypothetical protein